MDRVRILRDLEYLSGGLTVIKSLCKDKDENFRQLVDDWEDIIYSVIDEIEEEYKNAKIS